jgi:adenylate kinase
MDNQTTKIANWLGTGSIDVFGRPFSGKDTQGRILADLFNGELIAGGDIIRSHHDPAKIEQVLNSGGIIPSDFYLELLLPFLSKVEYKAKPLILSAVGRSHGEEPVIIKAAADSNHPLKAVILLEISEAEVWKRFTAAPAMHDRGDRADDDQAALNTRLKKYQDRTEPVIQFYRDQGMLIKVDGTLSRNEVTNQILMNLARYISK